MEYYILDVFAAQKYAGNQLAVVMAPEGMDGSRMQNIAREFNFSETTFITSSKSNTDGAWPVRIFTPNNEVAFAGHPTLGTAYVIWKEFLGSATDNIVLSLPAGRIPVKVVDGGGHQLLEMKQNAPEFGTVFDKGTVAYTLGLSPADIDPSLPVMSVSTGLPFIIVPVNGLENIKKARIREDAYNSLINGVDAKAIMLFTKETYDTSNDINVRMFAPYYGIAEDPATGSGSGCLAAYLLEYRVFGDDEIDIRSEQGVEIGRPSLLYLKAKRAGDKIDVYVGGRVIETAMGRLV